MRRRFVGTGFLIWAGWTSLAIFFATTQSLTYVSQGRTGSWAFSFATSLIQWWIWAALTPVAVTLARRVPLWPEHGRGAITIHLLVGVLVAVVKVLIEGRLRVWLFGVPPYLLISNIALQMLIYWALVAATHVFDHHGRSRARAAEAEAKLERARVQLLGAQLQPHFLFNALNAVAELIHEDPERADRMIGQLSDLLRATLEAGRRQEVTLDEELALVGLYLAIMQTRLGDRLVVTVDVPAEIRSAMVPHLLLQPIVENAIQHGLTPRSSGGRLEIRAARHDRALAIEIADDGVGLPPGGPRGGIGLTNTRARLQTLYAGGATLAIESRDGGGTRATVRLPFSRTPHGDPS
jgi:signal transduction histidine kinase